MEAGETTTGERKMSRDSMVRIKVREEKRQQEEGLQLKEQRNPGMETAIQVKVGPSGGSRANCLGGPLKAAFITV